MRAGFGPYGFSAENGYPSGGNGRFDCFLRTAGINPDDSRRMIRIGLYSQNGTVLQRNRGPVFRIAGRRFRRDGRSAGQYSAAGQAGIQVPVIGGHVPMYSIEAFPGQLSDSGPGPQPRQRQIRSAFKQDFGNGTAINIPEIAIHEITVDIMIGKGIPIRPQ